MGNKKIERGMMALGIVGMVSTLYFMPPELPVSTTRERVQQLEEKLSNPIYEKGPMDSLTKRSYDALQGKYASLVKEPAYIKEMEDFESNAKKRAASIALFGPSLLCLIGGYLRKISNSSVRFSDD